ncbi:Exo-poly-alpha-D-galacturonosidase precursor [Acidisarcina polymorpha]|uniref:Exo-poly-alpha-D-galacturonosidase n=1 Tax=Acidisarcina polymorpha TaxID=2211140 RepID=A0A2Z5FY94_9BACT|nr:glycoside hydrolase family 28 protein [Acidisarcina polymorpha]AXC11828.1 Exo-poly-alpha-D-galacturonosidase precursor [Acidisarcina polymorpha]
MTMEFTPRRDFLRIATAGLAGSVLPSAGAGAQTASTNSAPAAGSHNVKSYGATGDGQTIDSPSVNKAIDAAASHGGGTVFFPAGTYLSYSIHLRSNVALYLDQGATILAAPPLPPGTTGGYDLAEPQNPAYESYQDYGHNHWHNSLIWGEDIHDFSILGPGLIWGKGLTRGWDRGPEARAETPGVANKSIALKNCYNVNLRDFSILHGGHFGILATGVDNLTIDNLTIDTNRDGMDIDCCRNVRVSNCSVNSPYDDGICPKSSFALGYARPTEFVTISDCLVSGMVEGTLLDRTYKPFGGTGRIKFGTESNGGFRNITVANCVFYNCHGFALESEDGALLEDVTITNISMRDVVDAPLFLRLGSRMRGPVGVPVGTIKRVTISNVVSSGSHPRISSLISGVPGHPIEDLKLSNIHIHHQGGGTPEQANIVLPEKESAYPEPTMFGDTPSQGIYFRHVKGLEASDIKITSEKADARPVFVLQDVENADFFRIKAPEAASGTTFALNQVTGFSIAGSRPISDTFVDRVEKKNL